MVRLSENLPFLRNKRVSHHKLRHAYATALHSSGVSQQSIKSQFRHSSLAMAERYTHSVPPDVENAVASIDEHRRKRESA